MLDKKTALKFANNLLENSRNLGNITRVALESKENEKTKLEKKTCDRTTYRQGSELRSFAS